MQSRSGRLFNDSPSAVARSSSSGLRNGGRSAIGHGYAGYVEYVVTSDSMQSVLFVAALMV